MTPKDPFKYFSLKNIESYDSPIVYIITEEMVQEFAEANYDRRLIEKEVAQLFYGFCEDDHDNLYSFMDSAVEYALEAAEEDEEDQKKVTE